jgi:hypothetical protein
MSTPTAFLAPTQLQLCEKYSTVLGAALDVYGGGAWPLFPRQTGSTNFKGTDDDHFSAFTDGA